MLPKLKQFLNRTILASIPALFEDGKCRPYTLQSIEADGLWLISNALAERLLPERERNDAEMVQPVFVPAVQIAAIILPPAAAKAAAAPAGTQGLAAANPASAPPTKPVAATPAASPKSAT